MGRHLYFLINPPPAIYLFYLNIFIYFVCAKIRGREKLTGLSFSSDSQILGKDGQAWWQAPFPVLRSQSPLPPLWFLEVGSHTIDQADDSLCELLWPVHSLKTVACNGGV